MTGARYTVLLAGDELPPRALIGGKGWSVGRMRALGLPVPPAFVVTTRACAAFMGEGQLPDGLIQEIRDGIAWLEEATGRTFGWGARPLLVSVRSGSAVSMPGMMDTVLNLGMTDATEAALATECGDPGFARDTRRRFLALYGEIVMKAPEVVLEAGGDPDQWRAAIAAAGGRPVPEDVEAQLLSAVVAVFESWNSRRARRYRQHHGIPDDLGTAVTIQAMVFGNLDEHSGTGVVFSRNPLTGSPEPYGEFLARAQGEDVVSGRFTPQPLSAMATLMPTVHAELMAAASTLEAANREVQDIEFTVERGQLYLLQTRTAKRAPEAAARIAVDMVRSGLISEADALSKVTPEQIRQILNPRLAAGAAATAQLLARGEGACPGVGQGVVVCDSDEAERRSAAGEAIVLARPMTSPGDLHGMIAAQAVITEQGGSTSHAAVIGRALGRPSVVGCGAGAVTGLAGRVVTVDGESGCVYDGLLPVERRDAAADEVLAALHQWSASRTTLRVIDPAEPSLAGVLDLDSVEGGDSPERAAQLVAAATGQRGIKGSVVGSPDVIRAAIDGQFEFIVATPALPILIALAQATALRSA